MEYKQINHNYRLARCRGAETFIKPLKHPRVWNLFTHPCGLSFGYLDQYYLGNKQ